jgi:hypothetical protein
MLKPLTLLAVLLLFATPRLNARESKHIHEETDPYSGQTTLTLDVDTGRCPDGPSPGPYASQVHLLISATQLAPHQVAYNLTTDLVFGSIVTPGKNGTLDTLMDGLPAQLPLAGQRSKWRERDAFNRHPHNREMIPLRRQPRLPRLARQHQALSVPHQRHEPQRRALRHRPPASRPA